MIPVETFRHQQRDQFAQLLLLAGSRDGDSVEMPRRVEPVVVDPHRRPQIQRHAMDLLPVAGDQRQPCGDRAYEGRL